MPADPNKLSQFWQELKRRRVIHVIIVYATAAFVIIELVGNVYETLNLPVWTPALTLIILAIGFPIALIFSWIFDVTPEGIEKTKPAKEIQKGERLRTPNGWRIATYVSGVIIIVLLTLNLFANRRSRVEIDESLEKSVAVLPFENWSYEEEFSHLGNAIANEIITELYKIKEFRVLSHTSTMQYAGSKKTIPIIGEELGANYIIEGIVERQDNKVNIHVQVIRAKNEDHIWADEFEGEWKDIFKIQDDIALQVAYELKAVLSASEKEKIEAIPTDNLEAYNYYLRGNDFFWHSYEEQDYSIAINMYQKSIELDSHFALAYVMLAKSQISMYWFHHDRSMDRLIWGKEALDAAFEIDPDLIDAYLALGNYYYYGFLEYEKALEQYNIVLSLSPNNSESPYMMACVYRRKGEWQKAKDLFTQAFNDDPRNDRAYNAAETHFLMGEHDEAINLINQAINLNPDYTSLYIMKADAYLKWEGNTGNARKTLDEAALILNPTSYPAYIEKVVLLNIYEGKYQEAINFLKNTNFEAVQPQFYYHPKSLLFAWIYDLMGDKTKAVHYYDLSRIDLEARISDYPDDSRLYSSLGISYAGLGQREQAIRAGKKGLELLPVAKEAYRGVYRLGDLARIYVMVGEHGLALEQLDTLLSIPGVLSAKLLRLDPIWKPLWDHPEFIRLTEKYAIK